MKTFYSSFPTIPMNQNKVFILNHYIPMITTGWFLKKQLSMENDVCSKISVENKFSLMNYHRKIKKMFQIFSSVIGLWSMPILITSSLWPACPTTKMSSCVSCAFMLRQVNFNLLKEIEDHVPKGVGSQAEPEDQYDVERVALTDRNNNIILSCATDI